MLLLFDPEYLTAANHRKRHLVQLKKHESLELEEVVKHEVAFLNSILTSPLHRQTKSPTLWYHRYWLLSKFRSEWLASVSDDLQHLVKEEIRIVGKSGERHANNYYAWQYLRRLMSDLSCDFWHKHPGVFGGIMGWQDGVCAWCLAHPSDISGWSFLVYLLSMEKPSPPRSLVIAIVGKVLDFAEKIQWQGSGLLMFVKSAPGCARERHAERIKALLESGSICHS